MLDTTDEFVTSASKVAGISTEIRWERDHKARLSTLSSGEATNEFAQPEIVMCRWRDIEKRLDEPGPFIDRATRARLTPIDLGS